MNYVTIRVETAKHKGPLQIRVEFMQNYVADMSVKFATTSKVSPQNAIWQFKDRKVMVMKPFKAFDRSLLPEKMSILDVDKNLWQPESIFGQFFSNSGCVLTVHVNFIEEDEMKEKRRRMKDGGNMTQQMRSENQEKIKKRIDEAMNIK